MNPLSLLIALLSWEKWVFVRENLENLRRIQFLGELIKEIPTL